MDAWSLRFARWTARAAVVAVLTISSHRPAAAETIQEYAAECDAAMGDPAYSVPQFDCDDPASTEVPMTHPTDAQGNAINTTGLSVQQLYAMRPNCDRPDRLNSECDPGSRFHVLVNTPTAYVVAHCRKKGNAGNTWGDIAVIQHNRVNGATCFYQEGPQAGLLNTVRAPSDPSGNQWDSPATTAGESCGGCHDSGPVIRSPYLTQITGPNRLPGADDACATADCSTFNNIGQPYSFVGADFAAWKAYYVKIAGNVCNSCHRMGVNNVSGGGTARDFGIRATQKALEGHKNPHGPNSPLWMIPGTPQTITFDAGNAAAASAIRDCGNAFIAGQALPAGCTVTQYAQAYFAPPKPPAPQPVPPGPATIVQLLQLPLR